MNQHTSEAVHEHAVDERGALAFTAEGVEETAARESVRLEQEDRDAKLTMLNKKLPMGTGWVQEASGRLEVTVTMPLDNDRIAKNEAAIEAFEKGKNGEGPLLSAIPQKLSGRERLVFSARSELHRAENKLADITVPLGSRPGAPFILYGWSLVKSRGASHRYG